MNKLEKTEWKDFLLKSGLPLEYEVRKIFEKHQWACSFEYSYLRPDENHITNEFSFDINATKPTPGHWWELLIECKYRDPSTKWLFLPEKDGLDLMTTDFLHVNDYFIEKKFPFRDFKDFPPLAPLCSKGIELTSGGQNPKSITQAIHQISYGLVNFLKAGIELQIGIDSMPILNEIFYHIPIIVTTAELYRIKEHTSIEEIKKCKTIEKLATKEDILVLKTKVGESLKSYNREVLRSLLNEQGVEKLNSILGKQNKRAELVLGMMAATMPQSIVIIHHSPQSTGLDKLFATIRSIMNPSGKMLTHKRQFEKDKKKGG